MGIYIAIYTQAFQIIFKISENDIYTHTFFFAAFGGVLSNLYLYLMFIMGSERVWNHLAAAGENFDDLDTV